MVGSAVSVPRPYRATVVARVGHTLAAPIRLGGTTRLVLGCVVSVRCGHCAWGVLVYNGGLPSLSRAIRATFESLTHSSLSSAIVMARSFVVWYNSLALGSAHRLRRASAAAPCYAVPALQFFEALEGRGGKGRAGGGGDGGRRADGGGACIHACGFQAAGVDGKTMKGELAYVPTSVQPPVSGQLAKTWCCHFFDDTPHLVVSLMCDGPCVCCHGQSFFFPLLLVYG